MSWVIMQVVLLQHQFIWGHLHDAWHKPDYIITLCSFFIVEKLENGSTLHLLQNKDRVLSLATKEHIDFTPHYDTLIRSGTYEYFTIEGHNSVCKCWHDQRSLLENKATRRMIFCIYIKACPRAIVASSHGVGNDLIPVPASLFVEEPQLTFFPPGNKDASFLQIFELSLCRE